MYTIIMFIFSNRHFSKWMLVYIFSQFVFSYINAWCIMNQNFLRKCLCIMNQCILSFLTWMIVYYEPIHLFTICLFLHKCLCIMNQYIFSQFVFYYINAYVLWTKISYVNVCVLWTNAFCLFLHKCFWNHELLYLVKLSFS